MSLGDAEKMLKEHEDLKVGLNFFCGSGCRTLSYLHCSANPKLHIKHTQIFHPGLHFLTEA